jgi:hypothetical protein
MNGFGQVIPPTSDANYVFWQPEVEILPEDYQGKPNSAIDALMEQYGFSASASVGIWSILDIPKKKKDRYKKIEKVYFAPAFSKAMSYTKSSDPQQIAMQNLYLDICEIWTRWARKELNHLQTSSNSTGMLTIMYSTVKQQMDKQRLEMYQAYFKDVFIDKKSGAFSEWQTKIKAELEATTSWMTTPEECKRLISRKPIEPDYREAPMVVGPLFNER